MRHPACSPRPTPSPPCRRGLTGRLRMAALVAGSLAGAGCQTTQTGGGLPPLRIATPQALMGATPDILLATLGRPDLLRREAPAQVWQYRGDGCVLDFVLYDDAPATAGAGTGASRPRVTHVETRSRTAAATAADPAACLKDAHRRHSRPPASTLGI